ncbi:MAG: carbon-nitrogen hydrolase family protein [Balneolaceae bacterium]
MSSFIAAAIQLNSQPDIENNLDSARKWVRNAAREGAVFIGLPEHFAWLGDENGRLELAGEISDHAETVLAEWAREFGVYLLGGGYPVPSKSGRVFNRASLFNPSGEKVLEYNKMHLFDVELSREERYLESGVVEAGSDVPPVYDAGRLARIGLSICYDVRFPEFYRKLAADGAELLTVPSAFTRPTGRAHWEVLLRARAIENTSFVLAPAQTGRHGKNRYTYGHSLIIDPWGAILADGGEEPGMITAEIDLNRLEKVRKKLPSLKHRQLL